MKNMMETYRAAVALRVKNQGFALVFDVARLFSIGTRRQHCVDVNKT
jgi:hypothetical protein